ncbi:uncharacterized protein LOC115891217 [Sitophilus oryzae]|uniref:Uncharacterized protein LOC115891217 n=1 Tax=Sitophilus oryzae TaxID=7048 RepID=A0A6J2YWD5_SITOR|nr:uncharacterized protein LOC115891217 [Sitophilus oryzae]
MSEEANLKAKKASLKREIETRLENIEPGLNEFTEIILQLGILINNVEELDLEEAEYEKKYFEVVGKAKSIIKIYYNESDKNSAQDQFAPGSASINNSLNNIGITNNPCIKPSIKLPPITLPKFNGHYCSWLEFKDTFTSLIDQNECLNETQKFFYLKSSLDKSVLEVIQSVEVTANNYKVAWQILVDRFENKALMIHNHIQSIFEHPKLTHESHKDLRHLYDTVTKHLGSLKSLGENTDSLGSINNLYLGK